MFKLKEHITFKIVAFILVASLAIPTIIKFAHTFEHHTHQVCNEANKTHIHKVDLDCDFHKFQLNTHYYFHVSNSQLIYPCVHYKISSLTYTYFHKHRQLSFSLRGPPILV